MGTYANGNEKGWVSNVFNELTLCEKIMKMEIGC